MNKVAYEINVRPVTSGRQAPIRQKQSGFLVPLSLFIVVAAATLAIAISQMAAGSRSSAILTAFNAQAFYSADAGVQMAMHRLYYGNNSQAAVDAACTALDGALLNLAGAGLGGCTVTVSCDVTPSANGDVSLYTLVSQSQCGAGDYQTGRRIRTEAYMRAE
ncbi:MAG TPA: hypothetical protein VIC26_15405 [Marinagarivorans sp.]